MSRLFFFFPRVVLLPRCLNWNVWCESDWGDVMYKVVPVHMVLPSGSIWSFDPVNGEWCTHSMSTRTWCTWRHRGLIKPGVHIFLFSRQANFMFQNISHPSHLLPCSAPYLSYSILESITEKLISQQHQSVFLHVLLDIMLVQIHCISAAVGANYKASVHSTLTFTSPEFFFFKKCKSKGQTRR